MASKQTCSHASEKYELRQAIGRGDVEMVKSILKFTPYSIHELEDYVERTPLFLAVKNNLPLDIIHRLLQIYPKAASTPNAMGEIPLHVVRCEEAARLLIEYYPQGLYIRTKAKWLPIHTARTADVAKLLLEEGSRRDDHSFKGRNGSQVMLFSRDEEGLTPLEKLATSLEFCLSCTKQRTPLNHITAILWDKLCLLTKAMIEYCTYFQEDINLSTRDQNHTGKFQMVHSWIALRDTMVGGYDWFFFGLILEVALDLYPQQIQQKDTLGRTPLAIAISSKRSRSEDYGYGFECGRNFDDSNSFHLINSLLQRSKIPAGIPDRLGRMPLHTAIRNKLGTHTIKRIALSEPKVLMIKDPQTNLYPFMLAAIESNVNETCANNACDNLESSQCIMLNEIYYLLREAPVAVVLK